MQRRERDVPAPEAARARAVDRRRRYLDDRSAALGRVSHQGGVVSHPGRTSMQVRLNKHLTASVRFGYRLEKFRRTIDKRQAWPGSTSDSRRPSPSTRRSHSSPTSPTPPTGTPASPSPSGIDPGPLGVGARYRLGVRMGGRVAPMEYRVTTWEPSRRVVLFGAGEASRRSTTSASSRRRAGTRVDYRPRSASRCCFGCAPPFAGGAFARIARDARDGMQRALDSSPVGADPDARG